MDNFQAERYYLLNNFQHYRIVQPQVLFIHGLPSILSHSEILLPQLQKYGRVTRLTLQSIGKDFHSAFLELQSPIDAALLIVMLDEEPLINRSLRVFYGSTKFCPHYLKGHQCRLTNCHYAHYYHPLLTHLKDQPKQVDHYGIAHSHLMQDPTATYRRSVQLLGMEEVPNQHLPIPKAKLVQFLIQNGFVIQQEYLPVVRDKKKQSEVVEKWEKETEIESATETCMNSESDELTQSEDVFAVGGEEWQMLDRQIELSLEQSKLMEQAKQIKKANSSKIQNFLDQAQRFLSQLIFQSSQFVY